MKITSNFNLQQRILQANNKLVNATLLFNNKSVSMFSFNHLKINYKNNNIN